jgi:hypothetical protein
VPIRGLDRGDVLAADGAGGADNGLGPLDRGGAVELEQDIGEHAGPAAVAVEEGMDAHGLMVEADSLFVKGHAGSLPCVQIFEEVVQVGRDVRWRRAEVEFASADGAGPGPHLAEHLLVEAKSPGSSERCCAAGGLRGEVLERGLADVLSLGGVERCLGSDGLDLESGEVVEGRLAGDRRVRAQSGGPEPSPRTGEQFVVGALDEAAVGAVIDGLVFKGAGALHHAGDVFGFAPGLLTAEFVGVLLGEVERHAEGLGN